MKLRNILVRSILAAGGAALLAPSAHATNVSYTTGDLILGFELPGNANNYLVDLGPASTFINATSAFNATLNLGNLAADLSSNSLFGSNWATNNATQGTNVQWGIIGATSNILGGTNGVGGTFGLPKNTIFLTQAESSPGSGSAAPAETSQSAQGAWNSKIVPFASGLSSSSVTANSNFATIEAASGGQSWSANTPGLTAFGTAFNIEQPLSGSNFGPTNSALDLYELLPTNAGGDGQGKLLGTFTLSNSAALTYTPAPEPASLGLLAFGSTLLGMVRFRRKHTAV